MLLGSRRSRHGLVARDLGDDLEFTFRLIEDPWSWRQRVVTRVELGWGDHMRTTTSFQLEFPPALIDAFQRSPFTRPVSRGSFSSRRREKRQCKGVDAVRRAGSLAERASAAGDQVGELCGRIQAGVIRTSLEPEGATEKLDALVQQALPVFEAAGDDLALYIAYQALGQVANRRGQMDAALEVYERAAGHARQAGLPDQLLAWRSAFLLFGTTPVSGLLAWLDEHEPRERLNHWLRGRRAVALAMLGRFDEARAILAETRADLAERGAGLKLAAMCLDAADVDLWAGDPAAAAELGAKACALLDDLGEQTTLSAAAGTLAQALYALDRLEEAEAWAGRAAKLGASDDAWTQMLWQQVRGKVLARRGQHEEAEQLAREAVTIGEETDMLDAQGDAYADLAVVLLLVGKPDEAAAALEQAFGRYERKGSRVSAQRAQARLAELHDAAPR